MSEIPSPRIGMQDVIRHRAVQAAFPNVEAVLTRPNDPTSPTKIELSVKSSLSQPQDSKAAATFCETACVFNPNTQNPEIRALRKSQNITIECTGVKPSGEGASLLLPQSKAVSEVTSLAPCGVQLSETGIPTILLGRIPEVSGEKPEIKRYPWHNPFGRFVTRVNADYTANSNLLTEEEIEAINENTAKQVRSLRAAALALGSVSAGLAMTQSEALNLLALTGSFGAMATFGGAWFGISFGNIRKEFLGAAVKTTEKMLKPLLISMSSTYSALIAGTYSALVPRFVENPVAAVGAAPLILIPFGYAFLEGTKAIFQYDTSDLFSAGLTNEQLEYLKRENQLLKAIGIEAHLSPSAIRERLTQWRTVLGSTQPALET